MPDLTMNMKQIANNAAIWFGNRANSTLGWKRRKQPLFLTALAVVATARICGAADFTTTLGFDDLSPLPPPAHPTYVTTQYHAQGVDFIVEGVDGGTAPRVQYVGTALANSGKWVVLINYQFSEFDYGRMAGL